jgi:hypothetical protein
MNINKALKAIKAENCELRKAMKYNYSLVKYVLAEPPQTQDELEALLAFFAAVHLKYEQYEFQPGFGVVICLGAEAMLKRYRTRTERGSRPLLCAGNQELAPMPHEVGSCCQEVLPAGTTPSPASILGATANTSKCLRNFDVPESRSWRTHQCFLTMRTKAAQRQEGLMTAKGDVWH